jgi:hypothetical protein
MSGLEMLDRPIETRIVKISLTSGINFESKETVVDDINGVVRTDNPRFASVAQSDIISCVIQAPMRYQAVGVKKAFDKKIFKQDIGDFTFNRLKLYFKDGSMFKTEYLEVMPIGNEIYIAGMGTRNINDLVTYEILEILKNPVPDDVEAVADARISAYVKTAHLSGDEKRKMINEYVVYLEGGSMLGDSVEEFLGATFIEYHGEVTKRVFSLFKQSFNR